MQQCRPRLSAFSPVGGLNRPSPLRRWLAYQLSAWHPRKLPQCAEMVQPVLQ